MRTFRLTISVIFLLSLSCLALSQTTKADSLKTLLSTAKGQQYVDLLNKIGEAAQERHPDTAFSYANKALNLAKVQAYQLGMADAERTLGYYHVEKGELDKANSYLGGALLKYTNMANTRGEALCNKGLGIVCYKQGNYDKAIEYYNIAIDQSKKLDDKPLVVNLQNNNAAIYYKLKNFSKALEYYIPVQKYYEAVEDSFKLAITLANIGTTYMNMEDATAFSKGVGFLLKSIQIRRMIGDKSGLAGSYLNLAYVYVNRGDYKKSIDYMQQALDTYKEIGNKERIAFATHSMGELYQKASTIENYLLKAQAYTQEALQLAVEGNYKPIEIKCRVSLCYIMDKRGEFAAAEKAFSDAYTLLSQVGDSSQARNVLIRGAIMQDTIADGLVAAKKYTEAISYYEKAMTTFLKVSNKEKLRDVYAGLTEVYKKTGNKTEAQRYGALLDDVVTQLKEAAQKEEEARLAAAAAAQAEAEAKERARKEAEREDRRREESGEDEEDE